MYFNSSSFKQGGSEIATSMHDTPTHRGSIPSFMQRGVYQTHGETPTSNSVAPSGINLQEQDSGQSSHKAVNSSSTGGSRPFLQRILRIQTQKGPGLKQDSSIDPELSEAQTPTHSQFLTKQSPSQQVMVSLSKNKVTQA